MQYLLCVSGKSTKRINEVFARKTFYFDFKARAISQPAVRQIIEDINALGGVRISYPVLLSF